MVNIINNVLDKIKQRDIKPKSRFSFLAKNYAFWLAAIISIIIGAVTISVMLFVILNQDWELMERVGGFWPFVVRILPFFWLVIFVLFSIIVFFEVRQAEGGYKYNMPIILVGYVAASALFGSILYACGAGNVIERSFVDHAPFYADIVRPRHEMWQHPEKGMLVGKIYDLDPELLELLDVKNESWNIDIKNLKIPPRIPELEVGMMVRFFGEVVGEHEFRAETVRPHKLPIKNMMNRIPPPLPRKMFSQ